MTSATKKHATVLVSSAGRRVELLNCFREDARAVGIELRIVASDLNPGLSAACQAADVRYAVPRCTDPAFIPGMLEICRNERIDLLVPTIDTELQTYADSAACFAALGTRVAVSDPETVQIARDKLRTARFFESHEIPAPRSLPLAELLADPSALKFPVILKPVGGSCSIGLKEAHSVEAVASFGLEPAAYVAQEKWRGKEYTVNVFFDRNGELRAAVPHERCEVRAGEVSKGVTVRSPWLESVARQLAKAVPGARGALCFQAIMPEEGRGIVFEINARFGGGYPLAHRAGAQFTRWLLEETVGMPCTANDGWQEGITMLRYDAAVFASAGKR